MSASVLTVEEANKANLAVIEDADKGRGAMHRVVVALHHNRRTGTANTKTIAEVKHSNAKPWRQKGTGRARAGLTSSPIWRGGGVVFGPKPRDYYQKVTKKTRKLALRKALSERILAEDVLSTESFAISSGRTRDFVSEVKGLTDDTKVLIIGESFDETTRRAAGNVQWAHLMRAADVTTEHVLLYNKIIVTQDGLKVLGDRLS